MKQIVHHPMKKKENSNILFEKMGNIIDNASFYLILEIGIDFPDFIYHLYLFIYLFIVFYPYQIL
jgi:hypothetical protein